MHACKRLQSAETYHLSSTDDCLEGLTRVSWCIDCRERGNPLLWIAASLVSDGGDNDMPAVGNDNSLIAYQSSN
jgi:hypothetical protein